MPFEKALSLSRPQGTGHMTWVQSDSINILWQLSRLKLKSLLKLAKRDLMCGPNRYFNVPSKSH